MSRYDNIKEVQDENGIRVKKSNIYPPIPRNSKDIYLQTTSGDRLDLLANKYYGKVQHWWIIAEANALGKGSMIVPPGKQLRIPVDIGSILRSYSLLNP